VDDALAAQVDLVRRLVELGRATRAGSGVKTRQPLARALVAAPGWDDLPDELRAQLANELNVARVDALAGLGDGSGQDAAAGLVDVQAKGSFRALGKRFGPRTPVVAAAVAAADPRALADSLRATGRAVVDVDGEQVEVGVDEVVVSETPREGWAVASDGGETVALDLEVTPQLRRAGLARDVVRRLQEARKAAGFEVTDRVAVRWDADGELAEAVREHARAVADEVLATTFTEEPGLVVAVADGGQTGALAIHDAETGLKFTLERLQG
jgi:isoleucyl-tRNA synthetase